MYKVIVVDDEPFGLIGICKTFDWEKYGFEVIDSTTDAAEAIEMIIDKKPDVVFTDVKMPEISGIDLIKTIRKKKIDTQFVIISGYADFTYAQEAIKYNILEYCLKPIKQSDADSVLNRVKKALDEKIGIVEIGVLNTSKSIRNNKFKKLIMYISENFSDKLTLEELADKFDINKNYCSLLFKTYFGIGFSEYVMNIRMREAQRLICETEFTLEEVAQAVGCEYYYFIKMYKKTYGITPKKFKRNIQDRYN